MLTDRVNSNRDLLGSKKGDCEPSRAAASVFSMQALSIRPSRAERPHRPADSWRSVLTGMREPDLLPGLP